MYGGYEFTPWLSLEGGYSDLGDVKVEFAGFLADVDQFLIDANALQPPSARGVYGALILPVQLLRPAAVRHPVRHLRNPKEFASEAGFYDGASAKLPQILAFKDIAGSDFDPALKLETSRVGSR